jgi:glycosyl transferase, family 25
MTMTTMAKTSTVSTSASVFNGEKFASERVDSVPVQHCSAAKDAFADAGSARQSTAIRVVSLEGSTHRRTEFLRQVTGWELDWSFFSAHQGIASPLVYSERDAIRHCGRGLFPAEIGAYVSHFKCWEWLAHSEYDQGIILEDDVIVDWRTITRLAQVNLTGHGFDLLRLFATHPIKCKVVMYRFLAPHCHLVRTTGMYLGMQGYMLTKHGARRLVEKYDNITRPIDWVLTRYWEHKLGSYSLFPFPIIEQNIPSTIGARASVTEVALGDRAIRFCRRIRDRAKRECFDRWSAERWPLGPTIDAGPVFVNKTTTKH